MHSQFPWPHWKPIFTNVSVSCRHTNTNKWSLMIWIESVAHVMCSVVSLFLSIMKGNGVQNLGPIDFHCLDKNIQYRDQLSFYMMVWLRCWIFSVMLNHLKVIADALECTLAWFLTTVLLENVSHFLSRFPLETLISHMLGKCAVE